MFIYFFFVILFLTSSFEIFFYVDAIFACFEFVYKRWDIKMFVIFLSVRELIICVSRFMLEVLVLAIFFRSRSIVIFSIFFFLSC